MANFDNWVPDEVASEALVAPNQGSAIERVGRTELMASDVKFVPRDTGFTVGSVAKGATYSESDETNDRVQLTAVKLGGYVAIPVEDLNDSTVDIPAAKRPAAARELAKLFDNAALGATGAANGGTVPYTSVYRAVTQVDSAVGYTANANLIQTAGDLTFADLNDGLSLVEGSDWGTEIVAIVHPSLKAAIRQLVDANGNPLLINVLRDGLSEETLMGYPVVWSLGAKTNATASAKPTGNPLIVFANPTVLVRGVANLPGLSDGEPGFAIQLPNQGAGFLSDEAYMKAAMRRGFAVGNVNGVAVVEVTPVTP